MTGPARGPVDNSTAGSADRGTVVGMSDAQVPPQPPPEVPGYRLEELLGAGATGTVWAATRERDAAAVAVKVVPVATGGAPADLAARELGVLASVDVEGLVGFHEAVGLPGEPPKVAIVLDRVRGGSLLRAVGARGHLSVGESVTVLAPVARALAGLHAVGVVHGDVAPANVLLEPSGRPLLADLGVARLAGERAGDLYGTDGFVAPEVLDGAPPSPASDVYAVGALAWWCVTGAAPAPVALRQPLEQLAPGLPESWRAATTAALCGRPQERPTAAGLALAYFDSAQCEALRLVVGADETSLLTARLRSAAELPAVGPAPDRARRLRVPRVRLTRPRLRPLPMRGAPHPRFTRGGLAVLALLALAGCGAVLLDPSVLPWAEGLDRPAPTTGTGVPAAASTPRAGALVLDHASPTRDASGLVQELADLRAGVMNATSERGLALLDAPGSPALRQDRATLEGLRETGRRYLGVSLRVRSAKALEVGSDRASLQAVVDTAAYQVVSGTGAAQAQPARPGEPLRITLRWGGGRWQVERVDAAAR